MYATDPRFAGRDHHRRRHRQPRGHRQLLQPGGDGPGRLYDRARREPADRLPERQLRTGVGNVVLGAPDRRRPGPC
ncbi:MAG: hypothetical protein WDN45_01465 [Caulobacteraceae bacterium]